MGVHTEMRALLMMTLCLWVAPGVWGQRGGQQGGQRGEQDVCFPGEGRLVRSPTIDRNFPPTVEAFSYRLFKEMSALQELKGGGSMIISPYSIWSVLSLAYFGSMGQTQREIETALGFVNKTHTFSNWHNLRFYLESGSGQAVLNVANRGYFSQTLNLNRCLTNEIGDMKLVNFRKNEFARNNINAEVSNITQKRIPELIEFLDPQTRFALVNAIFFKGTWNTQFNPQLSRRQQFLVPPGRSSGVVQMMTRVDLMIAGEAQGLDSKLVELPYMGSNISMYLLLPNNPLQPLDTLVSKLGPATFATAVRGLPAFPTLVDISLPKFKLETRFEKELKQGLSNMGVTSIFDPSRSDLSGFVKNVPLHVDTAIHQAIVEVNEEGTVAAAATVLINTRVGPQPSLVVAFNRPFVFLIVEKSSQIPLFMGKVNSALDLEDL